MVGAVRRLDEVEALVDLALLVPVAQYRAMKVVFRAGPSSTVAR
jgi:hypothetical protein